MKMYYVLAMPEAVNGHGIVSVELYREKKFTTKPLYHGNLQECMVEKQKAINKLINNN